MSSSIAPHKLSHTHMYSAVPFKVYMAVAYLQIVLHTDSEFEYFAMQFIE